MQKLEWELRNLGEYCYGETIIYLCNENYFKICTFPSALLLKRGYVKDLSLCPYEINEKFLCAKVSQNFNILENIDSIHFSAIEYIAFQIDDYNLYESILNVLKNSYKYHTEEYDKVYALDGIQKQTLEIIKKYKDKGVTLSQIEKQVKPQSTTSIIRVLQKLKKLNFITEYWPSNDYSYDTVRYKEN